jgi:hypothetical protein
MVEIAEKKNREPSSSMCASCGANSCKFYGDALAIIRKKNAGASARGSRPLAVRGNRNGWQHAATQLENACDVSARRRLRCRINCRSHMPVRSRPIRERLFYGNLALPLILVRGRPASVCRSPASMLVRDDPQFCHVLLNRGALIIEPGTRFPVSGSFTYLNFSTPARFHDVETSLAGALKDAIRGYLGTR